jgi:uncharacterized protein YecT (DUF1311 family)
MERQSRFVADGETPNKQFHRTHTYKQLLAVVDEDAKQKLRTAQRAWVAYRDANAAFVYSMEGDGSAGRMVAWNDSERQTRARVDEMRNWLPRN